VIFRPNTRLSKHHPSRRRELSVRTFLYVEKLQPVPSCIRPDAVQCSTSYGISFQKHSYRKTAATVWTMCFPVQTLSFVRQVVYSKFNRPDVSFHGPDAQASYMEIACISSTVQMTAFMVRTLQSLNMEIACS